MALEAMLMDSEFVDAIKQIAGDESIVFNIGVNTEFIHQDDVTRIRYRHSDSAVVGWELKPLESLYEGDYPFSASGSNKWDDEYMPLLHAIESAIRGEYLERSDPKDKQVIAVLSRLVSKPEMRLAGSLVRSIQDQLRLCLSANRYSRKEAIGALRKVLKSVKRHHQVDGPLGYLEFIRWRG
jgi:hypothetical protein